MLPGKSLDLQDAVTLARRWWLLALVTTMSGLFAALLVSSFLRDMYRSEMLIEIVPQRIPDSFVQSTVTLRTGERIESLTNQLMARTQLEEMIREYGLYPRESARQLPEEVVAKMREAAGFELESSTRERGVQVVDAVRVSFTYEDPEVAAQVTQRLGNLIVERNARDRGAMADTTSRFLNAQLEEARALIVAQEETLERFRLQNAGRLPSQLSLNLQALQNTQLQVQSLVESIARDNDRRLILERLYRDALAEPVAPGATAEAERVGILSPERRLELAKADLDQAQRGRTAEHPAVRRAAALVAELEREVGVAPPVGNEEEVGALLLPAFSPDEAARREALREMLAQIEGLRRQTEFKVAEEARLRAIAQDYQQRLEATPGLESEWLVLTRDYETSQQTYRDLLTKSQASRVAADLERRQEGEQFRVLDPARVPIRPVGPDRTLILAAGGGLGLGVALAFVVLMVFADTTFRTEAEIHDTLGLPSLAGIPYVESAADLRRQRKRRLLLAAATVAASTTAGYVFWLRELWTYIPGVWRLS